jgi:PAS domain S-box-containing protein
MGIPRGLFRDLCENAHDLIQCVSPDGRFLYVNRAWLKTLGYEPAEVQRLAVLDVIHPDSRPHCERILNGLMEGHEATRVEVDFVAKAGTRITVEGNVSCRLRSGRLVSTQGIFRDITNRRRTQEQLDRLFDLSLDLLCVAGTDGYFKHINPAFERVLGYTRDELLSRSFLEFVHPDDRESTLREVENLARGRVVVDFQNRYRSRDGGYRWLAWRSTPVAELGLIYAVARDITEVRRTQELMAQQAAELARSNADLEQFAYVVSHDLRAPLRSIRNLAQWTDEKVPDEAPTEVRSNLALMQNRARRLETLIDDLLRYSAAGRDAEAIRRVDTTKLVAEVVELLAPPAGIEVSAEPDLPVFDTEKTALEQVLRNLIGNSIKHHDRPKGRIVVSAERRRDEFVFAVADDGPGIPERHHARVFEAFEKLESRNQVEGTGLGLALVKRLVDSHGGRVWLESGSERGLTVRFTWPKRIGAENRPPAQDQEGVPELAEDPDC